MLFQHFTWQQFLVAALVLSIIWYTIIILLFYRHRIPDLWNGKVNKNNPPEPLGHVWDEEFEDEVLDDGDDLMGKPALSEGMSNLSMAQFGFAPKVGSDDWDESRERQQSVVPDVLEELKNIFHILETKQGGKDDFISLFGLVSAKYPMIKGTPNEQALNDYIRQNVLFAISDEELDSLWNNYKPQKQQIMFKSFKKTIKEARSAFTHHIPYTPKQQTLLKTLMFASLLLTINLCFGQDGNAGINQATSQVKSYFDSGCNLMYAIGAVVGIIGAIKVFNKWNAGEPDTNKVAAAWFGSCVFLVIVATVLKSFFGL